MNVSFVDANIFYSFENRKKKNEKFFEIKIFKNEFTQCDEVEIEVHWRKMCRELRWEKEKDKATVGREYEHSENQQKSNRDEIFSFFSSNLPFEFVVAL